MPLKSRRAFPPSGFLFFEPRTNWSATRGLAFDQVVDAIIAHRKANPRFEKEWALSIEDVGNELDTYTCQRLGNNPEYCDSGDSPSFPQGLQFSPTVSQRFQGKGGVVVDAASKTSAGISLILDWLGSGAKAVDHDLAEKRASICVKCPKNNKASTLEKIFTMPVVATLRKQLAVKNDMKLSTSHDADLQVCDACWCVLNLKVHTPLVHVLAHTKDSIKKDLDPSCWILSQDGAIK